MKINKCNESFEEYDRKYPFKCRMLNRTPDPGICWIIKIDFKEEEIQWTNGYVQSSIFGFHNVEFIPDLFILNKYNL